jgi:phosphoserine aminotransferase
MEKRIYNFSAGPAILPEDVLKEAQEDLMALPGVGMSILEISHRSKTFDAVMEQTKSDIKKLLGISDDYSIMFLQFGASLQFSMVPMNIMPPKKSADYIVTGAWSKKAVKEAKRIGDVNIAATTEETTFNRIPKQEELKLNDDASYVHFTSNNTIYGTQFKSEPETGNVSLVCDAIFRNDLLERSSDDLPTMLNYKTHVEKDSMFNTPNTFGIYIIGLVAKWLLNMGGLDKMYEINKHKAGLLYNCIDNSNGFYKGHSKKDSRSLMNITFNLPAEELEKKLIAEALSAGFSGLKGHRSVGGLRASIYNAFPTKGVEDLVEFMKDFQAKNS